MLHSQNSSHALRDRRSRTVGAVEGRTEVPVELRAIPRHARALTVEDLDRQSTGIGHGPQHQRRHRPNQHRLRNARCAVAADIVCHEAEAEAGRTLEGLLALAEHSLILPARLAELEWEHEDSPGADNAEDSGLPAFRILETVRAYAEE